MNEYILDDVLVSRNQGINTTTEKIKYSEEGYKIIQAKNVMKYKCTFDDEKFVDEDTFLRIKDNHKLLKGDLLFSNIGSQMGNSCIYDSTEECIITWNVLKLNPNHEIVKPMYLCLWFNWKANEIRGYNSSSTMPFVSGKVLGKMRIELPDLEVQDKVVSVLESINNKINVNEAINRNLEEQAQALFDDFFLHHDVLPVGWKQGSLLDIADYLNGLAMQKFRPTDNEDGIPVLKIKELRQGMCDSSSELCSPNINAEYIVSDGDVIFSWSGSLLVDFWCGGTCGLNQHLFKVTSSKYDKWFYYAWTKHHLAKFIALASAMATTMGHIKRSELANSDVLIPSDSDYEYIGSVLQPIYDLIIANRIENVQLSNLRDELLPQLMSGELDVSEVEL